MQRTIMSQARGAGIDGATRTLPGYRFGGRNIRITIEDREAAARLVPHARTWKDS